MENWQTWGLRARDFICAQGEMHSCTRVMVNYSIGTWWNIVTDKAENRTRGTRSRLVDVSKSVVHWSSLRTRIQVMANLIGQQHEVH